MKKLYTLLLLTMCQPLFAQTLVAHYPLDGSAVDIVGSLNGTISGAPISIPDRNNNPNGALLFDGIDDCITVASSPINTTTNMSMCFWMYTSTNSLSAEVVLLGKDDCIGGGSLNGYSVYTGGFGPTSAFSGNGLTIAVSNVTFLSSSATNSAVGVWSFIVAQNNNGQFELYKNGVLMMSGVASMNGAPNAIKIGSATNCRFFPGAIDDLQIYNGALSQAQVTTLYNAQAPLPLFFTNFVTNKCNNNACLSWYTAQEINVSKFIIEKSADGIAFENIGEIPSKNELNNEYTFVDNSFSFLPINYYRIKSIDIDGKVQYSSINSLSTKKSTVKFTPNPATNYIELSDISNLNEVLLYDLTGSVLFKTKVSSKILLPTLPKGIYILVLKGDENTEVQKLEIQ